MLVESSVPQASKTCLRALQMFFRLGHPIPCHHLKSSVHMEKLCYFDGNSASCHLRFMASQPQYLNITEHVSCVHMLGSDQTILKSCFLLGWPPSPLLWSAMDTCNLLQDAAFKLDRQISPAGLLVAMLQHHPCHSCVQPPVPVETQHQPLLISSAFSRPAVGSPLPLCTLLMSCNMPGHAYG